MRSHRVATVAWVLGGGLAMLGMAMAVEVEMRGYPGGPQALADSIMPSAEAMRFFRWPAERLDTVGGYLTYHNVMFINLLLAVYGGVQGVRAVRGGEERHVVEELLAAGVSRTRLVWDRALGFTLTSLVIALGLGLGTAAGMALAGEPDLAGSLVTCGTSGLVALAGFAFGLLVSQVVSSGRAAAGITSVVLVALYVVTNLGEQAGVLSVLRLVSPFYYATRSRALVPGEALDPLATVALLGLVTGTLWLGAAAFARRDYTAALWAPRRRTAARAAPRPVRVPTALLGSVWTAALRRGWVGLLTWALSAATMSATFAALQPTVMDVWGRMDYITQMLGAGQGVTLETGYWSFAGEMTAPFVAGYVLTQASGWVNDLMQGRAEMVLAGPVSWSRLVVERCLAVAVGVLVITGAAVAALAVGAAAVGGQVDAAGLGRVVAVSVLLGSALAGLSALVVAVVRRPAAVTVLAVVVGASYLLTMFVPLLGWPDWLNRLSVFWAFGHPYLEWPPTSALVVLLVLAGPGTAAAAAVAETTPKVP